MKLGVSAVYTARTSLYTNNKPGRQKIGFGNEKPLVTELQKIIAGKDAEIKSLEDMLHMQAAQILELKEKLGRQTEISKQLGVIVGASKSSGIAKTKLIIELKTQIEELKANLLALAEARVGREKN